MRTMHGDQADEDVSGEVNDGLDARTRAYIASLHLTPDDPIPPDFEICPICRGTGCHACDARGRVHPVRVAWLEDHTLSLLDSVITLETVLAHPDVTARSHYDWLAAQSAAADALLEEWEATRPELAAALRAAGRELLAVSGE